MPLPEIDAEKPERKSVPPLTDEQVREALRLANCGIASDPRKMEAWRRWLVYSECFEPLIRWKFKNTQHDEHTINEACRFVDVSINLAKDLMDQICVVWDKPASRYVGLEPSEPPEVAAPPQGKAPPFGGPAEPQEGQEDSEKEEAPPKPPALGGMPAPAVQPPKPKPKPKANPQTEALRKLYRDDLKVDLWLQDLNKLAWWLTEAVVVPQIRKGHMRKRILLPFFYDPIQDPEDPEGKPLGYVYTLKRDDPNSTLQELMDPSLRLGDIVILDSQSWRVYKHGSGDPNAPHQTIQHGLGYVPAVPLRFSESIDGDPMGDYRRHRRVLDATITCSWIGAKMNYIRRAQDRKLFTLVGEIDQRSDDGQTPDPDTGVAFNAESPNQVQIQALDFNTDPANHIKQLTFFYNQAARPYGGTATEGLGEAGTVAPQIEFSHDAQTEIRVDQIPAAREFERELAAVVCDMAKQNKAGMDDPDLVEKLPEPDEIREKFSVQFAPLSRKFASFSEEKAYMDHQKANGLASPYDFAKRQDPDLTDEQARDFVLRKLEEAAEVNDIAASRNLPMDGESGMKTLPEVIGKTGPEARDNPSKGPPDDGPPDSE